MRLRNPTLFNSRYARWIVYGFAIFIALFILSNNSISFTRDNGFDLSDALVPQNEILHGGPGRDGIPAIDHPHFVSAAEVDYLKDNDRILGLVYDGVIRAYPIKILNHHEIVNDKINQQAIVISYCPLCGSGVAFEPDLNGNNSFGVSGLLYNSDMLLYDRQTESLWSQIIGKAITGKLKGNELKILVLENTSWSAWRQQHPATQVLSTSTGYFRNYDRHPYGDYDINRGLYFPVANNSSRFHPKERVLGLRIGDKTKAYPVSELEKNARASFTDKFSGQDLTIKYDSKSKTVTVFDAQQNALAATMLFWFAWYAFHPDTEVFVSPVK